MFYFNFRMDANGGGDPEKLKAFNVRIVLCFHTKTQNLNFIILKTKFFYVRNLIWESMTCISDKARQ